MKTIRFMMVLSAMLLFASPCVRAQNSALVIHQQVICDAAAANPQGQGCCSWHGGECGCSNGRDVCCDGSYSPTCDCHSARLQLADEYVHGYTRSDGTYVQGYMRSSPDGNPYNNYSFPGNTNPYTGKVAPGDPDTYLRNYYDRAGSNGAYSGSEGSNGDDDSDAGDGDSP
jgi:hypothetical protein